MLKLVYYNDLIAPYFMCVNIKDNTHMYITILIKVISKSSQNEQLFSRIFFKFNELKRFNWNSKYV